MKKYIAALAVLGINMAHAFMPQNGAWIVDAENTGKPGRGFVVDAQNELLGVQLFTYESSGQPTFYLASGSLRNNAMSAPLKRYTGGRYFGSGQRVAVDAGSPGNLKIRFTSGTTGYVTFPGEAEVAISRFNFGYAAEPSSLKGIWSMTSIGSEGVIADAFKLSIEGPSTENGNGVVASADGLFGCEHQVRGDFSGTVLCVKLNSYGAMQRGYIFAYSINDGEGISLKQNSLSEQALYVRRLATEKEVGTGIVFKSYEEEYVPHPALYENIEIISKEGLNP